jgi:hypothetical protein
MRLVLAVALCLALAGCGAVGPPLPPLLDIPRPATALSGVQRGERILLSWPAPVITTDGVAPRADRLGPVRIHRGVIPGLHATVAAMGEANVEATLDPARTEWAERIVPAWHGSTVVYAVEMPNRRGESAGLSNLAVIPVLAPPPTPQLKPPRVTETAVVIEWTPSAGRVYRDGQLVGESKTGAFLDQQFEFGRAYQYLVRAVARQGDFVAESDDSNVVDVTPEDTFPPRPPEGLQVIEVQGAVEVSWSPNTEADLAGYNLYRDGVRVNEKLIVGTTFRDAAPGKVYAVTAVDRRGNESRKGAANERE